MKNFKTTYKDKQKTKITSLEENIRYCTLILAGFISLFSACNSNPNCLEITEGIKLSESFIKTNNIKSRYEYVMLYDPNHEGSLIDSSLTRLIHYNSSGLIVYDSIVMYSNNSRNAIIQNNPLFPNHEPEYNSNDFLYLTSIHVKNYSDSGELLKEIIRKYYKYINLFIDGKQVKLEIDTIDYYKNNSTRETQYFYFDNDIILNSEIVKEYNGDDLIREKNVSINGSTSITNHKIEIDTINSHRISKKYYKNNQLWKIVLVDNFDNQLLYAIHNGFEFEYIQEFKRDSMGRVIEFLQIDSVYNQSKGRKGKKILSRRTTDYYKGDLDSKDTYFDSKDTYFDSNGKILMQFIYEYNKNTDQLKSRLFYEDGKLNERKIVKYSSNKEETEVYDSNNSLWSEEIKVFNDRCMLIEESMKIAKRRKETETIRYSYDNRDYLIRKDYFNYKNKLIRSESKEFEYF